MLGDITTTERGFQIIDFKDRYGFECSLQQSSLAEYEPPGTSAVWLGVGNDRMHLDIKLVEKLIGNLQNWLDNGKF